MTTNIRHSSACVYLSILVNIQQNTADTEGSKAPAVAIHMGERSVITMGSVKPVEHVKGAAEDSCGSGAAEDGSGSGAGEASSGQNRTRRASITSNPVCDHNLNVADVEGAEEVLGESLTVIYNVTIITTIRYYHY